MKNSINLLTILMVATYFISCRTMPSNLTGNIQKSESINNTRFYTISIKIFDKTYKISKDGKFFPKEGNHFSFITLGKKEKLNKFYNENPLIPIQLKDVDEVILAEKGMIKEGRLVAGDIYRQTNKDLKWHTDLLVFEGLSYHFFRLSNDTIKKYNGIELPEKYTVGLVQKSAHSKKDTMCRLDVKESDGTLTVQLIDNIYFLAPESMVKEDDKRLNVLEGVKLVVRSAKTLIRTGAVPGPGNAVHKYRHKYSSYQHRSTKSYTKNYTTNTHTHRTEEKKKYMLVLEGEGLMSVHKRALKIYPKLGYSELKEMNKGINPNALEKDEGIVIRHHLMAIPSRGLWAVYEKAVKIYPSLTWERLKELNPGKMSGVKRDELLVIH